ncbi:MAG TPA: GapR family DNA-binding domain-containing protein [Xanthobacteraceae bacterium]|nr:GapR family DNA-binding domain-containing protein [Xanthobacteraceae bacterium]
MDTDALKRFVDRIENLHDERKELNGTIRTVYDEIKEAGMDPATVRVMVKERGLDNVVRMDQYRIRDEYRRALGLYADTPLGEAAMERAGASKPKPFAEQPVHAPRTRRRPKLKLFDREHPQGAA